MRLQAIVTRELRNDVLGFGFAQLRDDSAPSLRNQAVAMPAPRGLDGRRGATGTLAVRLHKPAHSAGERARCGTGARTKVSTTHSSTAEYRRTLERRGMELRGVSRAVGVASTAALAGADAMVQLVLSPCPRQRGRALARAPPRRRRAPGGAWQHAPHSKPSGGARACVCAPYDAEQTCY